MAIVPVPIRTPMYDDAGNLSRTWILFFQSLPASGDTSISIDGVLVDGASQSSPDFKGNHLSVRMFGAKGDGVTDDTSAIQKALDFCAANSYSLYFPAGSYLITSTINLRARVSLFGDWGGMPWNGLFPKGTRIVWGGAISSVILSGFGVSGIRISGVSIDGGSISGCTGILWDSVNAPVSTGLAVDYAAIYNVGVTGIDGTGIQIGTGSGSGGYQCDSTSFDHVYIYLTHTGVHFNSFNSAQGGSFSNGQIAACVRGFLYERGGSLFTIQNVTGSLLSDAISGVEGAFFDVQGIHGPIIIDNVQVEAGWGCYLRVEGFGGIDGTIEIRSAVTGQKIALRTRRRVVITAGFFNCDIELSGDNILVNASEIPFLDPTAAGLAPFSSGTIQVTNGSADVQLNGTTEFISQVFDRGTFSTDGGVTEYIFTTTGLQKGQLDRAYTGVTNLTATYSIYNVPKRAFTDSGTANLVLPLTPGEGGALLALPAGIPGFPALRIEARDPNLVNPQMLELANGAQAYDFQVSGVGGTGATGSFALFDKTSGLYPVLIAPGAPLGAITVGAAGLIPLFAPDVLNSDGTGNLPNSFPDGKQYTHFVNGVAGFPGSAFGTVQGYTNSGSGYQYSYQIFHEVNVNTLQVRTATSATTWGAWLDFSGSGAGITALTGDVTASGPGSAAATLAASGVTAATYGSTTQAPQIAVDVKGRITAASNQTIAVSSKSTFTPVLNFGGATTGITYGVQFGAYCIAGDLVVVRIAFTLTSKGSATGTATITGLPFTAAGGAGTFGGSISFAGAMTGLADPTATLASGTGTITCYNLGTGTPVALADTNFTNTSNLQLTVTYNR